MVMEEKRALAGSIFVRDCSISEIKRNKRGNKGVIEQEEEVNADRECSISTPQGSDLISIIYSLWICVCAC